MNSLAIVDISVINTGVHMILRITAYIFLGKCLVMQLLGHKVVYF